MWGKEVSLCALGLGLSGCSAIPDVEYSYYLSKMNGVATAVQSVTCTPDLQSVVIVNTGTFAPSYSADLARGPHKIKIRAIEGAFGPFADSDASFGFYDDGRLKTINQTTTGQGETIIKSAVSLGTTVAGFAHLDAKAATPPTPSPACKVVQTWADTSKAGSPITVSLNYSAEFNVPGTPPPTPNTDIKVTDASKPLHDALISAGVMLPKFTLLIGQPIDSGSRASSALTSYAGSGADYVDLTLQRVPTVEVKISADAKVIWKGNVPIPTVETYDLPIPRAALFGSQKFTLTLSEAGAITAVEYGKNTGAAGATNAAGSIATALSPETTTTKAADIKAQADLIAQQQRLHRCQVNPTTCQ